jgi:hypothetical protein
MNSCQKYFTACVLSLLTQAAFAQSAPSLGAAAAFEVLGGTNVTCTAGSVVTGDVGVSPGTFTNTGCTFAGATPPATNAAAAQARASFLSAYAALRAQSRNCAAVSGSLSGQNLAPGVYCVDAVAKAGTLTLTGPSNGVWIFLVDGALTGTNFSVVMSGGQPCNVYWAPTAATTMTDSALKGNVLAGGAALGSITMTGGTLAGRAMANIAVTMTGTSVIGCGALSGSGAGAGSPSCKGDDRDGDDDDKDHKPKNGNPFGSHDDRDDKRGDSDRKGGDKK